MKTKLLNDCCFEDALSYLPEVRIGYENLLRRLVGDSFFSSPKSQKIKIATMKRGLNTLQPLERKILILKYGLDGNTPKSYGAIARELNYERDKLCKMYLKAIKNMRTSSGMEIFMSKRQAENVRLFMDNIVISVSTYNALKSAHINSIDKLFGISDKKLKKISGTGWKNYLEIKAIIKAYSSK